MILKQEDYEWPPAPKTLHSNSTINSHSSLGLPSAAFIGLVLGFFVNVAVVVVGSLFILTLGTIILGPTQYSQTAYKPILPYFVLDILFVLCQLPTVLLFFHKRREKVYHAYGMLAGGVIGTVFLVWFWHSVR